MSIVSSLLKKLKNFKPKANRTVVMAVLFFVALGLLFPQLISAKDCGMFNVQCYIINFVFMVMHFLTTLPMKIAEAMLSWVMEGGFLAEDMGYQLNNNLIIEAGWVPVRDFVNMFFIVGLVVIGIATAIRYKEYQAQKILPKLLIVALLINFTPALAAGVINASDTAMNHFLAEAGAGGFTTVDQTMSTPGGAEAKSLRGYVGSYMSELSNKNKERGKALGKAAFLMLFGWGATLILLMFALLFMVRYVVLWFLIIISPLAFFAYIFPFTRDKIWDPWIEQFVNWTLIGIPAAITLMISKEILVNVSRISNSTGLQGGGLAEGLTTFIASFTLPLIFMVIGYLATLQISAMGSKATINAGKTVGRNAGRFAGKTAKGLGKLVGAGAGKIPGVGPRVKNLGSKAKKAAEEAKTSTGASEQEIKQMGNLQGMFARLGKKTWHPAKRATARWATRKMASPSQEIEQGAEDWKDLEATEKYSRFEGPLAEDLDKIKLLLASIKSGQLKQLRKMGLSDEEIKETAVNAAKFAPDKTADIVNAFPEIADDVGQELSAQQREEAGLDLDKRDKAKYDLNHHDPNKSKDVSLTAKVTGEISIGDIPNMSAKSFENGEVIEGVIRNWSASKLHKAAQEHGKDFVRNLNKEIANILNDPKKGANWLESMNSELYDQLENTPGPVRRFSSKS